MGILASLFSILFGYRQVTRDQEVPARDTPDEGCDFRRARWGMSPDEVAASEDAKPHDRMKDHLIYHSSFAGKPMELFYVFTDQRLTAAFYSDANWNTRETWQLRDCEEVLDAVTRLHGPPIKDGTDWSDERLKASPEQWHTAVASGQAHRYATWFLGVTTIGIDIKGKNGRVHCRVSYYSNELQFGMQVRREAATEGKDSKPEGPATRLRSDIRQTIDALLRVQPRLLELRNSSELEQILNVLRESGEAVSSRSSLQNLVLAEIAFVHLNSDSGNPESALTLIEALRRNDEDLKARLQIDDSTALVKSQLLRVMYCLRQNDRTGTMVAITAFNETAERFEVLGDRELVAQVMAVEDAPRRDAALEAVREKLLGLFQHELESFQQSNERIEKCLQDIMGGGPQAQ